jgi:nucleotide-binding universal stress UspA family protein
MHSISKILVAVDFSENSARALDAAIAHATKFGASVELVHAFENLLPVVYFPGVSSPDVSFLSEARNAAKAMLERDRERVKSSGIEVRTHLAEVPAAGAITELAEEIGADLLVVGTHGHTGLSRAMMGSVAERTVRHAPCSVLVVK